MGIHSRARPTIASLLVSYGNGYDKLHYYYTKTIYWKYWKKKLPKHLWFAKNLPAIKCHYLTLPSGNYLSYFALISFIYCIHSTLLAWHTLNTTKVIHKIELILQSLVSKQKVFNFFQIFFTIIFFFVAIYSYKKKQFIIVNCLMKTNNSNKYKWLAIVKWNVHHAARLMQWEK